MHPSSRFPTLPVGVLLIFAACRSETPPAPPPVAPDTWTDRAAHAERTIAANGILLHYLDWGGSGPALILIHGYGDNAHAFDDLAPAFTGRFRVVAYDRRGHGRSEGKPPYDNATLGEDLRTLMDSLGIAKAHLAGWSMGGNEVTTMAGAHPDRVDRIVYLDAGYDWADPASVAMFQELPADLTPPASAMVSLAAYRASHLSTWFPTLADTTRVEAYIRGLVTVQPDGTVRARLSDSAGAAMFGTLTSERRDYRKVKAPALAIYSETFFDVKHPDSTQAAKNLAWEEKHVIPFRKASVSRLERELPGVRIVTVPGTHADFLFRGRDQVVAAMGRFLEGH